ncbi:MAG: tetratricopeptide repeat protein [Pseudomonadota bacterium]
MAAAQRVTTLLVLICTGVVAASPFARPDQTGQALMRQGQPEAAAQVFESAPHRAMALHNAGDTAGALAIWQSLGDAASEYNLGTTLTRLGDYTRAIQAFDRAMELPHPPADTAHNKAIAEQLLALQQQAPSEPQSGEGGEASESETPSAATAQDPNGDGEAEDSGDSPPQPSPDEGTPPDADGAEPVPAPEDARTERESQQATDQLLRRVPDDPAGLLRARIVREHQRRHGGATDAPRPW